MLELINNKPEIYRIYVPLPQNPLKNLNSYIVKTDDRNLIIDTGFNRSECLEALLDGLKELNIDMNKTDIFLTHLHSDHVGLVNKIITENSKIYMGRVDYEFLSLSLKGVNWSKAEKRFEEEGFPKEIALRLQESNQARKFAPEKLFEAILLEDGEDFTIGNLKFNVIYTPGHTPGHMCLYMKNEKILFSGDHILFDITPNITSWIGVEDSLKNYLNSLEKIKKFKIEKTLPGHRGEYNEVYTRIDDIIKHHHERLNDILTILKEQNKEMSAYEIAPFMKWNLRGKPWSEFPDNQKWFAMGETLSHLDYLLNAKKIKRYKSGTEPVFKYIVIK